MSENIQILVVEDQSIVREGLCAMLATKPGLQVVGVAADGEEAVQQALGLRPDVILMDLIMPKRGGIDATRAIIEQWPEARVLVLTSYSEDTQILEALRAGAKGYVLKQDVGQELVDAIHQVYDGLTPLNPYVVRRMLNSLSHSRANDTLETRLTDRELEIARLVARGYDNQNIASALGISVRTVGTHVSNILRKADVTNRTHLARLMLQQGLASLFDQ